MKKYFLSDYALNKCSSSIVYHFANEVVTLTLEDYLAENPSNTESDFKALKEISDAIYLEQSRNENAQTNKNVSLDLLDKTALCHTQSAEEYIFDAIEAKKDALIRQKRLAAVSLVLDKLTVIQRKRYLMHAVDGLSTWKIAELEGINQKTVYESLQAAEKKIKKFLENT